VQGRMGTERCPVEGDRTDFAAPGVALIGLVHASLAQGISSDYSKRNATTGSTRIARRAGM